jgi:hypothetical protein
MLYSWLAVGTDLLKEFAAVYGINGKIGQLDLPLHQ